MAPRRLHFSFRRLMFRGDHGDAAAKVREVFERHGLDQPSVAALLAGQPELSQAVDYVFGLSSSVPSLRVMRTLVCQVEERLDLTEPLAVDIAGTVRKGARLLRAAFASTVLALSGWTVVGAILTSQNPLAKSTSPVTTLAVLLVALVVLALLEAAHIGAVALSTSDVAALEHSHPRVFRLHHFIDSKKKLEEYLAARQVGVVLIVFVIAAVTRTASLSALPGTTLAMPRFLNLLFQIGAPGALLVLVLGQVAPQIVTARRPAAMMNTLPMATAFHLTRMIGHLGLARPASWLVRWARGVERIPSAPRERFTSTTVDVDRFGALMIRRDVRVGLHKTTTITESTVLFHDDTRTVLSVSVATLPQNPSHLRVSGTLIHGSQRTPVVSSAVEEQRLLDGNGLQLMSSFAPRVGCFQSGDVLDIVTVADYDAELEEDFVVIATPTKIAAIRVVLEHPPAPLPPALVSLQRYSDGEIYQSQLVPARMNDDDGSAEFFIAVSYPDPGSVIRLNWARTVLTAPLVGIGASRFNL